jgi:hypothetical protein
MRYETYIFKIQISFFLEENSFNSLNRVISH